jgi:crotonobetainyl-CoA:carnitine CoA-transferase CaiB-like acyl-CoA transferase
METSILNGIRVIDFTRVLAGPFATRCLADFGAEVIKIQSGKTAVGAESNTEGYFNIWNRNKRSILLDMSFPEAREIVLGLTSISDVVVENFSPRVMGNWGLGFETLKSVKDDLIMLSMSGMGRSGPWKDYVAFGPTVQSLGGLSYLTSYSPDLPQGMGYSHADPVAGLYGALAVLAALEYRDWTGEGQYIDLSEYEVVSTLIGPALMDVLENCRHAVPQGNRSDDLPAAPYGCHPCRGDDKWCVISVYEERQWQALCRVMGRSEWGKADRFASVAERKTHAREIDDVIGGWTSRHRAEEVVEMLQAEGVSAGVVQDARGLANDPQFRMREFFVGLKHPVLGETVSDRSPVRFQNDTTADWKAAPLLGKDNRYVYAELLGFSEDKLSSYIERGIIG